MNNVGPETLKLTPYEIKVFKEIDAATNKEPHYCDPRCSHLKDKTCGNVYFEHVTSSSGRWVKEKDTRCWEI